MSDLTLECLKAKLAYDPETGHFTWIRVHKSELVGAMAGYAAKTRSSKQYVAIEIGTKAYKAHRLAWFYMTGRWPVNEIDHRDNDGLNNQWSNLREATRVENMRNKRRRSDSTSGFKGVSPHHGKWRARIKIGRGRIIIGTFDDPSEAHAAYVSAATKLFGEFARPG